jgi:hypothetical protein
LQCSHLPSPCLPKQPRGRKGGTRPTLFSHGLLEGFKVPRHVGADTIVPIFLRGRTAKKSRAWAPSHPPRNSLSRTSQKIAIKRKNRGPPNKLRPYFKKGIVGPGFVLRRNFDLIFRTSAAHPALADRPPGSQSKQQAASKQLRKTVPRRWPATHPSRSRTHPPPRKT